MVKSNKFDYTGRTSSGPKLGRSIAADLEKRADKKQRDAQKTTAKLSFKSHFPTARASRKERAKSSEHDTETDTTRHDIHKLDIKVPGKALGDDGFALLCDGLQKSLSSCPDLALVDFNVSNNALSTRSLAQLAPVIRQSLFNLQTLDLSKNNFQVTNHTEARDWESFLFAFRDCMTLRRLDLGDNPSLGPWAMEILARVYDREPRVDPLPATGMQSIITLPDDASVNFGDAESIQSQQSTEDEEDSFHRCANGKTLADTWELGYRRGLRSLPYLTLTNVGLTDAGALFLSYVLEQHHYPIQLITEVNATDATNQVRTYRQDANLKGVDWDDNASTLGKDGMHLLLCAEKQRARNVLGDFHSLTSSAYEIVRPADIPEPSAPKKYYSANGRRTSIRSTQSIEYSIYDKSDVGSARKKIQRNTIVQAGCRSVELWHAALRAIATSRLVFMIAPEPREYRPVLSTERTIEKLLLGEELEADSSASLGSLASYGDISDSLYGLSLRQNLMPAEESPHGKRTYAATLKTNSSGQADGHELAVTDLISRPTTPITQYGIKHISPNHDVDYIPKGQHTIAKSLITGPVEQQHSLLKGTIERDDGTEPYIKYQLHHMQQLRERQEGQSDGYRDSSLRCQLPLLVCLRILSFAMDPSDLGVLKDQQQRTAFIWGQKRETLRRELEWMRKDESSQILMVLATAECVEY